MLGKIKALIITTILILFVAGFYILSTSSVYQQTIIQIPAKVDVMDTNRFTMSLTFFEYFNETTLEMQFTGNIENPFLYTWKIDKIEANFYLNGVDFGKHDFGKGVLPAGGDYILQKRIFWNLEELSIDQKEALEPFIENPYSPSIEFELSGTVYLSTFLSSGTVDFSYQEAWNMEV